MRDQSALLAATIESLHDGLLVLDPTGKELAYNRKLAEMWRIPAWGSRGSALMHMATWAREPRTFLATIRAIYSQPEAEGHAVLELKDSRTVEFHSAPLRLSGTSIGNVFSFRDVTEAKRAEANLRRCSTHDSLTGLPNRALLFDRIGQAIAQARRHPRKRLALLFVDLNGFRQLNDAHGHEAGDRVLLETGKRLVSCVRQEDTVARLAGDEFVVLLTDLTKGEDASAVAAKVLETLSRPIAVSARQVIISASIGMSLFPDHASDAKILLSCADRAMYRAKQSGRAGRATFRLTANSAAIQENDDSRSDPAI